MTNRHRCNWAPAKVTIVDGECTKYTERYCTKGCGAIENRPKTIRTFVGTFTVPTLD